jgi:hypothetical protein
VKKFRIKVLANGQFELCVNASEKESDPPNWVPASKNPFDSLNDAEEGVRRILRAQAWYFDESGKACD